MQEWGYSSAGRALPLQGRCQRFESAYLHLLKSLVYIFVYKKYSFRLNEEGLMVDTLALRDDEGRSYQR
jgi:hypothetical protein